MPDDKLNISLEDFGPKIKEKVRVYARVEDLKPEVWNEYKLQIFKDCLLHPQKAFVGIEDADKSPDEYKAWRRRNKTTRKIIEYMYQCNSKVCEHNIEKEIGIDTKNFNKKHFIKLKKSGWVQNKGHCKEHARTEWVLAKRIITLHKKAVSRGNEE